MKEEIDVLYIEDNEDYVQFVRRAFNKIDTTLSCHAFKDGLDALNYFESNQDKKKLAKLILLDVNLPGINGIELLKKIRSKPKLKYTPVIMFSTSDNTSDVVNAYDNGANAYLVKPEGLSSLVETLDGVYKFWLNLNHTSARDRQS
jgi:two-component system response regulator